MATASLTSTYNFLSGSRTECQLENPRERQRQLHAIHNGLQSSFENIVATSPDDSTLVSQIALSLTSIRALLSTLSPSDLLANERALKTSGESHLLRLEPVGLTVVLAEEWAPVSTTIMPIAAAIAAGCQSLLVLPSGNRRNDKIWEILTSDLLSKAIDHGGFGVSSYAELHDSLRGDVLLHFDAVVSQGTPAASNIVDLLVGRQLRGLRVLEPRRGGIAAAIISRSYQSSLDAVAAAVVATPNLTHGRRTSNSSKIPRVLFVDEFVAEQFVQELERASIGREKRQGRKGDRNPSAEDFPFLRLRATNGKSVTVAEVRNAIPEMSESVSTSLIVSTTSLDDAIDQLNSLNFQAEAPIVYHFAVNDEAAYLSQFVNAQQHIIGGIPTITQLVNPPADSFGSTTKDNERESFERACLGLLYSAEQFSKCRAVFNCSNKSLGGSLSFTKPLRSTSDPAQDFSVRKLDPINQSKGGRLSYFTQGLIVSLAVIVLPTIGVTSYGGWRLVSRLFW